MAEAPKTGNRGYLFPNKFKKEGDNLPDWRGKFNYKGEEIAISGWWKDKDGERFLSVSLTDPADLPKRPAAQGQGGQGRAPAPAGQGGYRAPAPAASDAQDDLGLGDIFSGGGN